jgi:hypothetical protein
LSRPDRNGAKSPGRPSRKISPPWSGRPTTASLLNDGQPHAAGVHGVTAHCLSSESELRVRSYGLFHRINEEMALGTRSAISHPRRSQIAPERGVPSRGACHLRDPSIVPASA